MNGCLQTTWGHCVQLSPEFVSAAQKYGIEPGALNKLCVEDVLLALLPLLAESGAAADVAQQLNALSGADIPSGAKLKLGQASAAAAAITNRGFTVKTTDSGIVYDMTEFRANLPSGVYPREFRVTSVDNDDKRRTTLGASGSLVTATPAFVTFEAQVESETGVIDFRRTVHVNTGDDLTLGLQVYDQTTGESEGSIAKHLEAMSATVTVLEQRVQDLQRQELPSRVKALETSI